MKKILVIEDNKRIATALTVRLRSAGYEVITAWDGHDGLVAAVNSKPDLILSDIWMPSPLGFLNRERLHNLGLGQSKVIYITASRKEDLRTIALQEGAAAFFEKPYDPQQLLAAVAHALDEYCPQPSHCTNTVLEEVIQ